MNNPIFGNLRLEGQRYGLSRNATDPVQGVASLAPNVFAAYQFGVFYRAALQDTVAHFVYFTQIRCIFYVL